MLRMPFTAAPAVLIGIALAAPAGAHASTDEVVESLRTHPTQVLEAPLGDESPAAGGGRVLDYPLDNVARVAVDGRLGYVVSSVPLTVDGAPLSYDFEKQGDQATPSSSPVEVNVDLSTGDFQLEAPGGRALRVRRLGDAGPDQAAIVDGRAVLSGTDESADSVYAVTGRGLESFEVLRNAAASTTLRWRVDLPDGWSLRPAAAGAAIYDAQGQAAYNVTAPWARDADGHNVDLALSTDGADVVQVSVATSEDTAFPVVVDPDWASTYDFGAGSGAAGWFPINQPVPGHPSLGYTSTFAPFGMLAGLWIWPTGSMTEQYFNLGGDGQEVRGGARFEAPGTTRIQRIDFGQTLWELRQEDCSAGTYRDVHQYLRFVLRDRNANTERSELQIGGPGGTGGVRNTTNAVNVPLVDPAPGAPTTTSASVTMWTEARPTGPPKWIYPNPRPPEAGCADAVSPFVRVGRVDITLVDTDSPVIDEVSGQIRDWANSAHTAWINADPGTTRQATGTVRMHDAGSGLDVGGSNDPDRPDRGPTTYVRATKAGNGAGRSVAYDLSGGGRCDAQHQNPQAGGRLCPDVLRTDFTAASPLDLAELVGPTVPEEERDGPWDLRVEGSDLVGHNVLFPDTPGSWRFFVDTTPPTASNVTLADESGADIRDRWIRATSADATGHIRVSATAADPAVGGVLSGLRRLALWWSDANGATRDLIPANELQCDDALVAGRPIEAPCPSAKTPNHSTIPRHLAPGEYTATAEGYDFAGNGPGPSAEASTWVDNEPPEVSFSGTLADLDGAWIAPSEAASLDVTATDPEPNASGVRRADLSFKADDGSEVEPSVALASCDTQPGAGSPVPPAPLCPTPASGSATVDTASWPHGRVDVLVDAEDAVGNKTPKADADIVVHVDRRPPETELLGELAELADRDSWVVPNGPISATIHASDEGAGISRLEIWAKDEQGSRRLAERQVCTPPAQTQGDDPPCPLDVTEDFEIDPSAVGDGTATFEVRAIEFTGRVARVRETLKLDGTPPPPVENLRVERVLMTEVASWDRPEVPAASAPIIGYEYAVVPAGETVLGWTTTPDTRITLPMLPFDIAASLHVCAVEETGARSACRQVGIRAKRQTDVLRDLGIDEFEKMWGDDSYRNLTEAASKTAGSRLASGAATFAKAVSRASFVAEFGRRLIFPEETGCGAARNWSQLVRQTRYRNGLARKAFRATANATRKTTAGPRSQLKLVDQKMDLTIKEAREVMKDYKDEDSTCLVHPRVAIKSANETKKNVDTSVDHLERLRKTPPVTKPRNKRPECWEKEATKKGRSEYRWNLCWLTGEKAKYLDKKDIEAHHMLPRKFRALWDAVDLDWQDPRYLCWMARGQHRSAAREFNDFWNLWWGENNRRNRASDEDEEDGFHRGILTRALELSRKKTERFDHRCYFPPKKASWRAKQPWPVDVKQRAEYKP